MTKSKPRAPRRPGARPGDRRALDTRWSTIAGAVDAGWAASLRLALLMLIGQVSIVVPAAWYLS